MHRCIQRWTFLTLAVTCGAFGDEAKAPFIKSVVVPNVWTTHVSPDNTFSYSVCPASDTRNGCRTHSTDTLLLLLGFRKSIPYIPLQQFLNHYEVSDTTILSTSIHDPDLLVRYTASNESSKDRKDFHHDVYKSGWMLVSNNGERSYLICPGSLAKEGEGDLANAYRCKYKEKRIPLTYLKSATESLLNKTVIRQSVMEVGNTLDVYSYLSNQAPALSEDRYPPLESLKVLKVSNETKENPLLILFAFLAGSVSFFVIRRAVLFLFGLFFKPTRRITPPAVSQNYTPPVEVRLPTHDDNFTLLVHYWDMMNLPPTAVNRERLRYIQRSIERSNNQYLSNELRRMREHRVPPRSFSEVVNESESVALPVRAQRVTPTRPNTEPASLARPIESDEPKNKRKVYVD